jgi:hypothetical protein
VRATAGHPPQVDDVADQVEAIALQALEECRQFGGVAVFRPEMGVGEERRQFGGVAVFRPEMGVGEERGAITHATSGSGDVAQARRARLQARGTDATAG